MTSGDTTPGRLAPPPAPADGMTLLPAGRVPFCTTCYAILAPGGREAHAAWHATLTPTPPPPAPAPAVPLGALPTTRNRPHPWVPLAGGLDSCGVTGCGRARQHPLHSGGRA